jgi:hypothetical protein
VLLDMGGTLWHDDLPWGPAETEACLTRSAYSCRSLRPIGVCELFKRLREVGREIDETPGQDSTALTQRAAQRLGLSLDRTLATAIRRAMAGTAQRGCLFDGVPELLRTIRELGEWIKLHVAPLDQS